MTCAGGDHHQQPACCCDDRDGWYRVAHGENHMWIPGLGWGIDQGCACHVIEQFLDDELWDAILASPTVQAHAIGNRIRVPVRIKYGDYDTWRILPAWKETR
jgi:hypothetical protein